MKPHGLIYLRHENILFLKLFLKAFKSSIHCRLWEIHEDPSELKAVGRVYTQPPRKRSSRLRPPRRKIFASRLPRLRLRFSSRLGRRRRKKELIPRDHFDKRAKCARQRDFALPPDLCLSRPHSVVLSMGGGGSPPVNRRQVCASAAAAAQTFSPFLPASLIKKKNLS